MTKNILLALLLFLTGTSVTGQEITDGTWKLDAKSGIWQTNVMVKGVTYKLNAFSLENGKVALFVHETCPGKELRKIIAWSAGDLYAAIKTCDGKDERSLDFHIYIERELLRGLPIQLQEKLKKFHRKKTTMAEGASLGMRVF